MSNVAKGQTWETPPRYLAIQGNPKLTWFRLGPIPKEGRSLIVERYNPGQARTPAIAAEEIRGASEIVGHYQRCVVVDPCTAEGKARVET